MNKRARIHSALVAGKKYLAKDCHRYVCCAINSAYHDGVIGEKARDDAKEMIRSRLGQYYTVGDWLQYVHHIDTKTDENMLDYRHRWLASMIKEFSK